MRGVVVSPEIVVSHNSLFVNNSDIAPIKLRQYLMYWDEIDFPTNNAIYFEGTPEVNYLQSLGILKRSHINLGLSGQLTELFLKSQYEAFRLNSLEAPGSWAFAQPQYELSLLESDSVKTRTLEVELYQSLPIPTAEVPLEKILEFKVRRNDELLEFRELVDNLYSDIITSGDQERAK